MWAGDVMTRNVISVAADAPAMQAVTLMLKHRISGLPVVDGSGRVVGVLSETDLLREDGKSADGSPWL